MWEVDFAAQATEPSCAQRLARAAPALVKPYDEWLSEDYLIFHIREIDGAPTVPDLIQQHAPHIAQVVRGDTGSSRRQRVPRGAAVAHLLLRQRPRRHRLERRLSLRHSPPAPRPPFSSSNTPTRSSSTSATTTISSPESSTASTTLLDKGTGFFARWRLARSATQLHTVLLDVAELTEHADNAIKFLTDMFAARFYRLAASKVGVPDYRDLVTQKVRTAEELYRFMVDQFNQSRAFLLELTVVIILVIELFYLFRGKPI